jgi:DNA-directed RNA polymerase subunit RPC12/RpoP
MTNKVKCIDCKKEIDASDESDDEYFSIKVSVSNQEKQAFFCLDCTKKQESRKTMLAIIKNNPELIYDKKLWD